MLKIRLTRVGAKKKPRYRVVVIEDWRARDSRCVEIVGHYNPQAQPAEVQLDRERIDHWMKCGAQPSVTVARLLKKAPVAAEPAA
jgi:small subunit ribosomal protein S16